MDCLHDMIDDFEDEDSEPAAAAAAAAAAPQQAQPADAPSPPVRSAKAASERSFQLQPPPRGTKWTWESAGGPNMVQKDYSSMASNAMQKVGGKMIPVLR